MGKLDGRIALVTGGGSGIGNAGALKLASEGATVAILGRTEEKLKQAVGEIEAAGAGKAIYVVADIQYPEQVEAAINEVAERLGGLHIVFANAGINGKWAPISEISPDDFRRVININLEGTFFTIKYAVPHIRKSGQGGSIIITSSVNGTRIFSNTGATPYASTKAAQIAMGKMLAQELAHEKIRVNVICPGPIKTSINEGQDTGSTERKKEPVPLTSGKPGSPEQVADLVLFLASDDSSFITGTEMWIDGGQSLQMG